MKFIRLLCMAATLLATACGSGNGTSPDAPASDGPAADAPAADGPAADAPPGDAPTPGPDSGAPDAGADPDAAVATLDVCLLGCATPADCNFGSAPYDADNYTCQGGACVYAGCTGDTECQAIGNYRCRSTAGSTVPLCLLACTTASDCDMGSAVYDSDNYACPDGVCVYTGCNSDTECQTLGDYRCRTTPGSSIPYCQRACTTTGDCNFGSAPYDADNYDCPDGVCVYTGCNDNTECQTLGNYVCASSG